MVLVIYINNSIGLARQKIPLPILNVLQRCSVNSIQLRCSNLRVWVTSQVSIIDSSTSSSTLILLVWAFLCAFPLLVPHFSIIFVTANWFTTWPPKVAFQTISGLCCRLPLFESRRILSFHAYCGNFRNLSNMGVFFWHNSGYFTHPKNLSPRRNVLSSALPNHKSMAKLSQILQPLKIRGKLNCNPCPPIRNTTKSRHVSIFSAAVFSKTPAATSYRHRVLLLSWATSSYSSSATTAVKEAMSPNRHNRINARSL